MGERNMKAVAFGINVEGQKDEFWAATAGKGGFVSTLDTYAEVEMTPNTIPFVRAFKERYKKSPELVKEMMTKAPVFKASARFIVFKRWDALEEADDPEVVIFFARPDVVSGLVQAGIGGRSSLQR